MENPYKIEKNPGVLSNFCPHPLHHIQQTFCGVNRTDQACSSCFYFRHVMIRIRMLLQNYFFHCSTIMHRVERTAECSSMFSHTIRVAWLELPSSGKHYFHLTVMLLFLPFFDHGACPLLQFVVKVPRRWNNEQVFSSTKY